MEEVKSKNFVEYESIQTLENTRRLFSARDTTAETLKFLEDQVEAAKENQDDVLLPPDGYEFEIKMAGGPRQSGEFYNNGLYTRREIMVDRSHIIRANRILVIRGYLVAIVPNPAFNPDSDETTRELYIEVNSVLDFFNEAPKDEQKLTE